MRLKIEIKVSKETFQELYTIESFEIEVKEKEKAIVN